MKQTALILISLMLLGFAGSIMAGKDAKTIRHCGCVYDSLTGVDMVFHDVMVAGKSKGHRNHLADSEDLCFAGLDDFFEPTFELWARSADDCMVDGINTNLVACDGQEEFTNCGDLVPVD
jgi:hypothetical protein